MTNNPPISTLRIRICFFNLVRLRLGIGLGLKLSETTSRSGSAPGGTVLAVDALFSKVYSVLVFEAIDWWGCSWERAAREFIVFAATTFGFLFFNRRFAVVLFSSLSTLYCPRFYCRCVQCFCCSVCFYWNCVIVVGGLRLGVETTQTKVLTLSNTFSLLVSDHDVRWNRLVLVVTPNSLSGGQGRVSAPSLH